MGKCADVTDNKKQSIRALLQSKALSNIEIAIQEGVSKHTVIRIKRKMEQATLLKNGRVKKCGRKRKTTALTDRYIQREFLIDPFKTAYQQAKELRGRTIHFSHDCPSKVEGIGLS